MYRISAETPQDLYEIEALFDLCFAPGREALSSYRLRDDVAPVGYLCHVARDGDGILAGAIRFWPVTVSGAVSLLLGPVAVHPTRQGEGLAGDLIRLSLERAGRQGWARVMLVGDAPYYRRFGFEKLPGVVMPPPTNPERVLGRPLRPEAWHGVSGEVGRWQGEALPPD
ncbi:GNAT family N-acetyltransferase [Roseobacter sinensis]|uniref:N-acetyltransferase n=1 Tax=Roseobacter sinensis TaxID=2931391 RepID=A0ABT3BG49_9RHOB|nr:N-acetyltransferase [Roseobacter sp. WL0113]MCV3272533.1 N-acetyltransferase [Roseobacter sp. WL0113]